MLVDPLEVADEDLLQVGPRVDAAWGQVLEPSPSRARQVYREVLDDKEVIGRSPGSAGEPVILQPYVGVHFPSVLGNVGGRSESRQELRILDSMPERAQPRSLWTRAPVVLGVVATSAPALWLTVAYMGQLGLLPCPASGVEDASRVVYLHQPFGDWDSRAAGGWSDLLPSRGVGRIGRSGPGPLPSTRRVVGPSSGCRSLAS